MWCGSMRLQKRKRRGWTHKGARCARQKRLFVGRDPISVIAAYNVDGFVPGAICIDHEAIDGDKFVRYFAVCIAPILGNHARGDKNSVVLLDNARTHRRGDVHRTIQALCNDAGALLIFLPRYQPWYNPIELGFAAVVKEMKSKNAPFRTDADVLEAFYKVQPPEAKATLQSLWM
uniref:Tc1-like transposase DDE domain-containing protein n=1 Tax=Lotharella oceanica TaxID=641309 RepID=A0A7S2U0J3_9EUKA|mmetsp:Transcript_4491/g.9007  ORF Transcript_4491/g.9007 Transcript_4491/m.9007 type:complete len:175 (+) Transcript_4491:368-892(+)